MKLRYVFPLMVAAAVAGGVAVHFRAAEHGKPMPTARPSETVESRYRIIADTITSLCPLDYEPAHRGVNEVFTEFTRSVEEDWAKETEKFRNDKMISRAGPWLRIKTKAKDVEFLDVGYLCHDVGVQIHRYRGMLAKIGWHSIEVVRYEGAYDSILVSAETGEQIKTFEKLFESPSGKRLAAFASEEGEGARGLEIFRVEGVKLASELNSGDALSARHPLFTSDYILELIGWIDDESLLLIMHQSRQAKLSFRSGQWQLEYLDP